MRQIRQKRLVTAFRVPQERVGTVHTTQGKEAAVVILVPGGSGPSNSRARAWVAEKPNLLNVAVSRAKERLYIIGNRSEWKSLGGFSIVVEHLNPIRLDDIDCPYEC